MSLLKQLRSQAYRIRAVGYVVLGIVLLLVVMNNASWWLFTRALALGVAFVAIIGGLKRALYQ